MVLALTVSFNADLEDPTIQDVLKRVLEANRRTDEQAWGQLALAMTQLFNAEREGRIKYHLALMTLESHMERLKPRKREGHP